MRFFGPRAASAVWVHPETCRWVARHGLDAFAQEVRTTRALDPTGRTVIGLRPVFRRPEVAEAFGFERGDVLVSLDGHAVRSRSDLLRLARDLDGAAVVTLVIDRRGVEHTFLVDPRDPEVQRSARYLVPPR